MPRRKPPTPEKNSRSPAPQSSGRKRSKRRRGELDESSEVEIEIDDLDAFSEPSEPPADAPAPRREKPPRAEVLHADEHLLVVNKPAGVLSVAGRGEAPVLADVLRAARLVPADEPFRVVQRLDEGASGVMVFARTLLAQQFLTAAFGQREVEKVYVALVQGYVVEDGEIDLPLRVDDAGGRVRIARRGGKASQTSYRIVERIAGHTLLECRPHTGRLHQIRAHLAAIGHPLAVDPLYGGGLAIYLSSFKRGYRPSRRRGELPLIDRLTLHAARLSFDHPAGTGRVAYEAPLPKDLRATLNQLRRV